MKFARSRVGLISGRDYLIFRARRRGEISIKRRIDGRITVGPEKHSRPLCRDVGRETRLFALNEIRSFALRSSTAEDITGRAIIEMDYGK